MASPNLLLGLEIGSFFSVLAKYSTNILTLNHGFFPEGIIDIDYQSKTFSVNVMLNNNERK